MTCWLHARAHGDDGYTRFQAQYTELFAESPSLAYWPAAVPKGSVAPACPTEDVCWLPPPDPNCDNREPEPEPNCNNCTGTDTDTDDDSDSDDDRDQDSNDDGDIETPTQ